MLKFVAAGRVMLEIQCSYLYQTAWRVNLTMCVFGLIVLLVFVKESRVSGWQTFLPSEMQALRWAC